MRSKRAFKLSFVGVLATAVVSVAEGLAQLTCARTPTVLLIVAGSFGAGASLTALLAEIRSRRSALPQA